MPPLHYSITPPLRLLFLVFIHNFKIGVDHVVTALPATPRSSAVGPLGASIRLRIASGSCLLV
jgi:hypothetical protein